MGGGRPLVSPARTPSDLLQVCPPEVNLRWRTASHSAIWVRGVPARAPELNRHETGVIRGENGKSVALVDALKELEELPAPAGVDASLFAQLKSAPSRQLNTYPPSRRDPAEGRVSFSPAGRAGLKPSVIVEELARERVADPPLQVPPYAWSPTPPRA